MRGLIQITGRANYVALMMALDVDCVEHPELIEQPEYACRSAGWFWDQYKNLNPLADSNNQESFIRITKKVNGGTIGLANRLAFWVAAKKVLGVT